MSESLALPDQHSSALGFADTARFEHIQRVASMFAKSQLVPTTFQNNVPNVVIALEISQRIGASALMVMQNLNIIHGKPSFGASFMIATVNACGRFTPLRFVQVGTRDSDDWGCYAVAKAKVDNFECKGVTVTMGIAKAEGWTTKNGSKWKTMPELMLQYRAATWWVRAFAPELLMGFPTTDEVTDVDAFLVPGEPAPEQVQPVETVTKKRKGVNASKAEPLNITPPPVTAPVANETEVRTPPPVDNALVADGCEQFTATPEAAPPKDTTTAAPAAEPEKPGVTGAPVEPAKEIPAPAKLRCEITAVEEKQAKKAGGTIGPVCTVTLKGEYAGTAYFDGARDGLPQVGAVGDATLIETMLRGAAVKILTQFVTLA